MLELTGFLGLTRISFFLLTRISQISRYCFVGGKSHRCFCAWVARADSTLLLGSHGSHRSHSIAVWVGNLTDASVGGWLVRIPLGFWAHTDLTDPTVSLCGWEISQMLLWVGNLTDGSVGVGSWGLHGARSHGLIFWTLRTNQTYRTNRTDWTFLKIIREWDLCEASVGLGSV